MKFYLIFVMGLLMGEALRAFAQNPILLEEKEKNVRKYIAQCMEEQSSAPVKGDCLALCILTKMGFLVNYDIQMDVIKRTMEPLLGPEKFEKIMKECLNIKGSLNCETAAKIWECYLVNAV